MYHVMKKRRHIAEVNIKLCFPNLSEEERQTLVKSTFHNLYISLFETAMSWWAPKDKLRKMTTITGLENLEKAVAKGNGVLLVTGHFTCVDLGGSLIALFNPITAVYKRHKNPYFERKVRKAREGIVEQAIQHHNMRELIKALKQNKICWYAPDQDFGRKNSVFAPFMGVEAASLKATARIAKITGAAVVPFFPRRFNDGSGYHLTVLPELENFPTDDDVKDATVINTLIEEQVLLAPDQYLWLHRRFKTRPRGEPRLYGFAENSKHKNANKQQTQAG